MAIYLYLYLKQKHSIWHPNIRGERRAITKILKGSKQQLRGKKIEMFPLGMTGSLGSLQLWAWWAHRGLGKCMGPQRGMRLGTGPFLNCSTRIPVAALIRPWRLSQSLTSLSLIKSWEFKAWGPWPATGISKPERAKSYQEREVKEL